MNRISKSDLSLFILIIMIIYMMLDNSINQEKVMILGHYLGALMAAISLIFYFITYRFYKYFILFVLLLGTFNLIFFTNPVHTLNFRLEVLKNVSSGLYLQTLSFVLFIFHLVLNSRMFFRDVKSFFDRQS